MNGFGVLMDIAVILQSNYIPWRGYFDMMRRANTFVIYDEVQYTKRDWRNRNRIMANGSPIWLSIPVQTSGKFLQSIAQTKVVDSRWIARHWTLISQSYSKSPYYAKVIPWLKNCYEQAAEQRNISQINEIFLRAIANYLEINTNIIHSIDIPGSADRINRLVEICASLQAKTYLTGPAALDYLDEEPFVKQNINVEWMRYPNYTELNNQSIEFPGSKSIIDTLFNVSKDAVFQ